MDEKVLITEVNNEASPLLGENDEIIADDFFNEEDMGELEEEETV